MIPEDFRDYFTSCNKAEQEQIVEALLSLSDGSVSKTDIKGTTPQVCPHCFGKELVANGRLSGVQH